MSVSQSVKWDQQWLLLEVLMKSKEQTKGRHLVSSASPWEMLRLGALSPLLKFSGSASWVHQSHPEQKVEQSRKTRCDHTSLER